MPFVEVEKRREYQKLCKRSFVHRLVDASRQPSEAQELVG